MSTISRDTARALQSPVSNTNTGSSDQEKADIPSLNLPDEPLVIIQSSKSWSSLNLIDLWRYRELLYFLTWRDVKIRYKQTVLGVAWVVMQPLLMTLIFTIFLGKLARVPSDGLPYPL